MTKSRGMIIDAALLLGISPAELHKRIKKYDLKQWLRSAGR